MKIIKETSSLYEKALYPYDREFNKIILEFNKFLSHWNFKKRDSYLLEFRSIRNLLNEIAAEVLK